MAELSLREQIAQKLKEGMIKDFNDLYVKEFTTEWKLERWCRKTEINLMTVDNSVDSIINLMLAKVDKAGLTDEQIKLELTKYAHEIMSSNPIRDWNQTELIKIVAKAQLQAIKSILEGK